MIEKKPMPTVGTVINLPDLGEQYMFPRINDGKNTGNGLTIRYENGEWRVQIVRDTPTHRGLVVWLDAMPTVKHLSFEITGKNQLGTVCYGKLL